MTDPARAAAAEAAADAYPRIVATLIRITGDWTLAEDSAQEALATALARWPATGVPANPGGWLMTVARNRALDALRRASVEERKLREAALLTEPPAPVAPEEEIVDDRLRLIFTCCHPALPLEARVALTLRVICAVPTADIARAFLVRESTMTRRITRAKAKIADAGIPYAVPGGPGADRAAPRRPGGALPAVHPRLQRGRRAGLRRRGDPARPAAVAADARPARAGRAARALPPPALAACRPPRRRRGARDARRPGPVALGPRRDRRGARAPRRGSTTAGPYALQAEIAACHATAASAADTDWHRIADRYDALARIAPSPVIELNRAVAHGYAHGPAAGLALLAAARAGGALDDYPLAVAAEAELTARDGDRERAAALFRDAAARAHGDAERRALLDRAAAL